MNKKVNYESAPEPVKQYFDNLTSARKFRQGREHLDYKATAHAMDELFEDGYLHTDRLYNKETRDKVLDKISQFYQDKYEEVIGIEPETPDAALKHFTGKDNKTLETLLISQNQYSELNSDSLYELITKDENGNDYNKQVEKALRIRAGAHLKDEHLDQIADYLKKNTIFDELVNKELFNIEDAKDLLFIYHNEGAISEKLIIQNQRGRPPYLKGDYTLPEHKPITEEMQQAAE
ncbi:MAG: hypothetical protein ACOCQX_03535, partial [Candidatus Nanoarchaeia archaeon]